MAGWPTNIGASVRVVARAVSSELVTAQEAISRRSSRLSRSGESRPLALRLAEHGEGHGRRRECHLARLRLPEREAPQQGLTLELGVAEHLAE